jgi:hypothetical protein
MVLRIFQLCIRLTSGNDHFGGLLGSDNISGGADIEGYLVFDEAIVVSRRA